VTLALADTGVASPTLVPELSLHLLLPDSPHWHAEDPDALGWPYWAVAWPGGQALARFVLDHPEWVRGLRVLDFGAGGAVEGLAAKRAGATQVCCADVDPRAEAAALANARLNGVELCTTSLDLVGAPRGDWDVILAGDVCFEPALAARVLEWLQTQAAQGCPVLLGDPGRVPLPAEAIEVLAEYQAPHDGDVRALTRWVTRVARVRPEGPLRPCAPRAPRS
jgi:predicted nicotinamide N-methyase